MLGVGLGQQFFVINAFAAKEKQQQQQQNHVKYHCFYFKDEEGAESSYSQWA